MRQTIIAVCFTVSVLNGQMKLSHTEKVERSFPATARLGVDNISGSIHVVGYAGNQIQLTAVRTDEADTQEGLARAAKDVTLKTEVVDGQLEIYPDGPFRQSHSPFRDWEPKYHFNFDITVKVPMAIELNLRNVNKGGIHVEGVTGHFSVREVNGPVEMTGVSGDGDVHSVNGKVTVSFARNPTKATSFRTVNGAVEVQFQPGLSAELRFKTMHGGVYTDFDFSPISTVAGAAESKNGKYVYTNHGFSSARVGSGGPEIDFETLNGEIRILKK